MRYPRIPFDLAENALARIEAAQRAAGRPILDLTTSNPTTTGLDYPAGEILASLADPRALVYEPSPRGLAAAREAVAATYETHGVTVDPERVVLTASSSESYSFLFKLLCAPGDRVRVPRPSYPLFDYLAALEAVELQPYPVRWDGTWHRDIAALEHDLVPRTRAVLVVSPDNPTGAYLHQDEAPRLAALAIRSDLAVIADEVFLDYPSGAPAATRAPPVAGGLGDALAFALGGLSKTAGLPQLKLGWIVVAGPDDLADAALARLDLIADTYLSVATPVLHAAPRLLALAPFVQRAIRERVAASRAALDRALATAPECSVLPAEGGWYAVVRLPAVLPDETFAERLLEEEGVLVHPGSFFGFAGGAWLVVSLLARPEVVEEGATGVVALVRRAIG